MAIEIIGWSGVFFYLIAYLLLVLKKISPDGYTYHIMNAIGAIGLIVNAFSLHDVPNIAVNAAWLTIAAYASSGVFSKKIRKRVEKRK